MVYKKVHLLSQLVVLVLTITSQASASTEPFDSSLSNYELLTPTHFKFTNIRKRRSETENPEPEIVENLTTDISNTNELKFAAHGRQFHLVLRRGSHLITSPESALNIEVRYADGRKRQIEDTFTSNYYIGRVVGVESSSALVYYDTQTRGDNQPIIYAKIQTFNETFYVEPLLNATASNSTSNSYIVYKSDDVRTPLFSNGLFNQSYCHSVDLNDDVEKEINAEEVNDEVNKEKIAKRQASSSSDGVKNRCGLALVADWTFFEKIGNSDVKMTTLYMVSLFIYFILTTFNCGSEKFNFMLFMSLSFTF